MKLDSAAHELNLRFSWDWFRWIGKLLWGFLYRRNSSTGDGPGRNPKQSPFGSKDLQRAISLQTHSQARAQPHLSVCHFFCPPTTPWKLQTNQPVWRSSATFQPSNSADTENQAMRKRMHKQDFTRQTISRGLSVSSKLSAALSSSPVDGLAVNSHFTPKRFVSDWILNKLPDHESHFLVSLPSYQNQVDLYPLLGTTTDIGEMSFIVERSLTCERMLTLQALFVSKQS